MLKYKLQYDSLFMEGIENLELSNGKYKFYISHSFPMLIQEQSRDILYGRFEIRDKKIWSLAFEQKILDLYKSIGTINIYKDLIIADKDKRLLIDKDEDKICYYFFDENMKLSSKEFKDDDLDKFNKENHNYFESSKYKYNNVNNKMKEHIKNYRLNLLSTFSPD